jgi:osmotically-inducible protein OsmY
MEQEDQLTQQDILDSLNWDARLGPLSVNVEVREGHVTLTGVVPTYFERRAVERVAYESPNVLSVDNRVEIAADRSVSDREITNAVLQSLRRSTPLADQDVEVSCNAGVVTLTGTVDAYWKRNRIRDIVSEQSGVVDIVDSIGVAAGNLPDEQLSERISRMLMRKAGIDENTVAVEVRNGEVTLRGTVPTWMARSVAYETAANVEGVREVFDELTIDQR